MHTQGPVQDFRAFELARLERWVTMLGKLEDIVAVYPSEVLDERRTLLNRVIFNQCASLSRSGLELEVDTLIASYRSHFSESRVQEGARE